MKGESPATSDRLDQQIERMKCSECEGFVPAPVVEQSPKLSVGSEVVILAGILKGHIGTCREFRGKNVKVVTNMFGGETPVWHNETNLSVLDQQKIVHPYRTRTAKLPYHQAA